MLRSQFALHLVLSLGLLIAGSAEAVGDPYYTVIDLGVWNRPVQTIGADGQQVLTSPQTGVSYPFPTSNVTLTPDELKNLPGVNGFQGATNPQLEFFQMRPMGANSFGTVIGAVPSGDSRAIPWSTVTLGFAVKGPDGQYSSFEPLTSASNGEIFLNAKNQILLDYGTGSELLDFNNHTSTNFQSLIPPGTLSDGRGNNYRFLGIFPYGLADNGVILGSALGPDYRYHTVLVTPPGVPMPVPEPTTLATIVFALSGMAIHRRLRRAG